MNVTREQLAEMIRNTNGRVFTCCFTKRTGDRENRVMNARLGVKKFLKGGERAYDFEEKGLIGVCDMQKLQYRTIAVEGLVWAQINGNTYEVTKEEPCLEDTTKMP